MKALLDGFAGVMGLLSMAVLLYGAWLIIRSRIKPIRFRRRCASPQQAIPSHSDQSAIPARSQLS